MNRARIGIAASTAALLVCASGCNHGSTTTSATSTPRPAVASTSPVTSSLLHAPGGTSDPTTTPTNPPPAPPGPAAAGSCHARGSGFEVLPDPSCTPGAINPAVSQGSIHQTICSSGWTATVRPPESYTEPLKYQQMAAYGDAGSAGNYEEDHLIPLELGGSPTNAHNLWPEPGASPNPKDSVESAANHAVCDGQMTLTAAQQAIAADWIVFGRQLGVVPTQTPTTGASTGQTAACSARASYSTRYGDWDVYVHSNQPDQSATVTASGGATASYHTDSGGYADVYLHAPQSATGQRVTVTVGHASCSTTL